MPKPFVYGMTATALAIWSVVCYQAVSHFRHDPVVFFETVLIWAAISAALVHLARILIAEPQNLGRIQSKTDSWIRLQRAMREEEKKRRSCR